MIAPRLVRPAYPGAWGWPVVQAVRVPREGDRLVLPNGSSAEVIRVADMSQVFVHFEAVEKDSDGHPLWSGHLRDSSTGDGLYLEINGAECDGHSVELISEGRCDCCGAVRVRWRVLRGGRT